MDKLEWVDETVWVILSYTNESMFDVVLTKGYECMLQTHWRAFFKQCFLDILVISLITLQIAFSHIASRGEIWQKSMWHCLHVG